ncbi:MAG: acetylxylan esterase [Chloroflexota bacterium]|jgi:cephalosporin-C deacetylase
MAYFDLPLEQLREYRPPRDEPSDFDAFWQETLRQARAYPLDAVFEPVDYGLRTLKSYDVTFNGYAGQPIKGWLSLPAGASPPLPVVVEYIGYGGGRGLPSEWLLWASAGFAHLVMDTRGQGSVWRQGDTPDLQPDGASPHAPGFMTLGVLSPETYYYRRVFVDAARAVEAACVFPLVDSKRVAVTGGSQGGGISIAAAALADGVQVCMPDVPYLCHYRRAVEITASNPYQEIAQFCQIHRQRSEQVFRTLAYFDGVNFAARIRARCLFSVGLMDEICPPSTVFAAYNWLKAEKEIRIYAYNHHEGGGAHHEIEKVRFLQTLWE